MLKKGINWITSEWKKMLQDIEKINPMEEPVKTRKYQEKKDNAFIQGWLESACHMIQENDRVYDSILDQHGYQEKNTQEFYAGKYFYRVIAINFILFGFFYKHQTSLNDQLLGQFDKILRLLPVEGNNIMSGEYPESEYRKYTFERFGLDKLELVMGVGGDFGKTCIRTVTKYMMSRDESKEVTDEMVELYNRCFDWCLDIENMTKEDQKSLFLANMVSITSAKAYIKKLIEA